MTYYLVPKKIFEIYNEKRVIFNEYEKKIKSIVDECENFVTTRINESNSSKIFMNTNIKRNLFLYYAVCFGRYDFDLILVKYYEFEKESDIEEYLKKGYVITKCDSTSNFDIYYNTYKEFLEDNYFDEVSIRSRCEDF